MDTGSPWPGLTLGLKSGFCEPWPFSWAPGEGWGLLGLGGTRLTMPLLFGTAGFRLPLKLVLSATLTGTAIYQVCPAFAVPFASGPLSPTPKRGWLWPCSALQEPTTPTSCLWYLGNTAYPEGAVVTAGLTKSQCMSFGVT